MQILKKTGYEDDARHRADGGAIVDDEFRTRALQRIARERLDRIAERRDVAKLRSTGLNQRQIADRLRTTQPRISRIEKAIELLGDPFAVTPEELILRCFVDHGDRHLLLSDLTRFHYTASEYAPYPAEGKRPGTWEQVRQAYVSGFLTEEEFHQVKSAVRMN